MSNHAEDRAAAEEELAFTKPPSDLYRVHSDGVVWCAYARAENWDYTVATIGYEADWGYAELSRRMLKRERRRCSP
jgi:hypothetical protein